MNSAIPFPKLEDWAETRDTLHAYCKVLGAIRGACTAALPNWWHISLRLYTAGLTSTSLRARSCSIAATAQATAR